MKLLGCETFNQFMGFNESKPVWIQNYVYYPRKKKLYKCFYFHFTFQYLRLKCKIFKKNMLRSTTVIFQSIDFRPN